MAATTPTSPTPPRLTGDPKVDNQSIVDWAWSLYRNTVIEARTAPRLDAVANVPPLTQTISASPTQAQVQALQDKINAIITAAN